MIDKVERTYALSASRRVQQFNSHSTNLKLTINSSHLTVADTNDAASKVVKKISTRSSSNANYFFFNFKHFEIQLDSI